MAQSSQVGFPRHARLLKARDYRAVFDDVQFRAGNRCFLMLATPSAHGDDEPGRIGLIIARRHVRRAVDRNRLKRLIRESFRHRRDELAGLDIVILARPGAGQVDNEWVFSHLDRLWRKLLKQAAVDSPDP